jgi:hypothetical protein
MNPLVVGAKALGMLAVCALAGVVGTWISWKGLTWLFGLFGLGHLALFGIVLLVVVAQGVHMRARPQDLEEN